MRYLSPLRYPGGKAKLAPFFDRVIRKQDPRPAHYAEPFAGGAGAALRLLVDGTVSSIHLNDINPGIASFWRNVFQEGERFARAIESAEVTLDAWKAARETYLNPDNATSFDLGMATFFLNRTNRSGILTAGPIGGLDQKGNWKIDARYNHEALAARVRLLYSFRGSVSLYELDALDFMETIETLGDKALVYVDPPYVQQGDDLYMHAFDLDAHSQLSKKLTETSLPWVLTYDVHKKISDELYNEHRLATFDISHTAHIQHVGSEYVVFSPKLNLPDMQVTARAEATWI